MNYGRLRGAQLCICDFFLHKYTAISCKRYIITAFGKLYILVAGEFKIKGTLNITFPHVLCKCLVHLGVVTCLLAYQGQQVFVVTQAPCSIAEFGAHPHKTVAKCINHKLTPPTHLPAHRFSN